MSTKRKTYSAEFKAKLVFILPQENQTTFQKFLFHIR